MPLHRLPAILVWPVFKEQFSRSLSIVELNRRKVTNKPKSAVREQSRTVFAQKVRARTRTSSRIGKNSKLHKEWFSSFLVDKPYEEVEAEFIKELDYLSYVGATAINVSEQSGSIQGQLDTPVLDDKKRVLTDEEWDRFTTGLNKLGKLSMEKYGIRTCFHHHMGTVCQTVEETTRLMENTDPKYVFLCFDTGHFTFAGEDPVKMLEKFADRVGHVHLKNMRMPLVEKARAEHWSFLDAVRAGAFTVPGDPDGCVEFDAVFDLLDKAGYTGWIMVEAEQDPAKANPFEYAKMGREYITAHTGLGGEVVLKK